MGLLILNAQDRSPYHQQARNGIPFLLLTHPQNPTPVKMWGLLFCEVVMTKNTERFLAWGVASILLTILLVTAFPTTFLWGVTTWIAMWIVGWIVYKA
jgi:hypothetical protein